ncbi:ArsR/SmtB family transcription factor [Agrobacterium salinitolerans]|uniref:ArsR/SmtB family transcription factor n=1 Tax=Agrobacterium salinitolerans TaxID=1183413 RepID=UPI0035B30DA3
MMNAMQRIKPSDLMTALSNPRRLDVLRILVKQETSVRDLAAEVGLSQSALSQHLAKLRARHLVETRRDAQTVYYSSRHPAVRRMLECLRQIEADQQLAD